MYQNFPVCVLYKKLYIYTVSTIELNNQLNRLTDTVMKYKSFNKP